MSSYRLRLRIAGTGLNDDGSGGIDRVSLGDAMTDPSVLFTDGGATIQQAVVSLAVANGTPVDLDLNNSTNTLKDKFGRPFQLTKLYFFLLVCTTPGSKTLRFGPLGQTNGVILWQKDVNAYEDTDYTVLRVSSAGFTVNSTTLRLLRIQNQSAGTCNAKLWLVGAQ